MQPKPIDSRRLLDIDRQRRIVDMEGFASHLRGVQEQENPVETDYDVVHDEESRRDGEEISRESVKEHATQPKKRGEDSPKDDKTKVPAENGKGSRLDVEA